MIRVTKNKIFAWSIKSIITVLFCYAIYNQFKSKHFSDLFTKIADYWSLQFLLLLLLVLLMMVLNWSIETLKWKLLIGKLQQISFWQAFKGVLSGVTLGTFTPNRIGEFGGRIMFLKNNYRIKGIVVTLIGSFGQIITTLLTGLGSFCIYLLFFAKVPWIQAHMGLLIETIVIFSTIGLAITVLIIYFNVNLIERVLLRIKYVRKFKKYLNILTAYGYLDLLKLLGLSFFRFFVFAMQFYILLYVFHISISFFAGMVMISLIFFVQTLIPSFTLTEIGVRGQVSVFFLCYLTSKSNSLGIVYASLSLWIINLIIPAIIGAVFMLQKNIYENEN